MDTRTRSSLCAWRDAFGTAAFAAVLTHLLAAARPTAIAWLLQVPATADVVALVVVAGAFAATHRGRIRAAMGLKRPLAQPPTIVVALIGTALLIGVLALFSPLRAGVGLGIEPRRFLLRYALGCVAFAVILVAVFEIVGRRTRHPTTLGPAKKFVSLNALATSFDALTAWLQTDDAVAGPEQDAFGHSRIAERIATRLRLQPIPSQAVVGALGSGKSTIRRLVERRLAQEPGREVRIVPIELWQFETSRAAVEHVLKSLVDAIGKEVETVALRGLPAAYAELMTAAGGFWSALARIQHRSSKPQEMLRALETLAERIGIRYVLWIEDLERFAGGQPHLEGEGETAEESARLAPIRALLQLACLVVNEGEARLSGREMKAQYTFDPERAARLFGTADVVLEIARKNASHARSEKAYLAAFIDAATQAAASAIGSAAE